MVEVKNVEVVFALCYLYVFLPSSIYLVKYIIIFYRRYYTTKYTITNSFVLLDTVWVHRKGIGFKYLNAFVA